MRTIINVGLGLALAFCLVFFVSGKFEKYVDKKVEAALAERLGAVEEDVVAEEVEPTSQPAKVTANNREYIEVRSSKGKAKIYIGQSKADILDLLGTPDGFDFGGTNESCRYKVGYDYLWLRFANGKLTDVKKY